MRNLKRFYAVVIAIVMLVSMIAPAMVFAATPSDYAADAKALYEMGLYKGLDPNKMVLDLDSTLNRETAATMVLRLFGLEEEALKMDAKEAQDILVKKFPKDGAKVSVWAARQVAYAVDAEIIKGFPDGTFQPQGLLTGTQYSVLVMKLLGYSDWTFETVAKKFGEVAKLDAADQAAFASNSAIKKSILTGMSRKALDCMPEGATITLAQQLVNDGALDLAKATEAGVSGLVAATVKPLVSPTPVTTPGPSPVVSSVPGETYGAVAAVNDLPAGNLIVGSTLNKVLNFNVTAPATQDLTITSLTASELGTAAGDTSDIQRVYLMDGESVLVAGSLNNGSVRLNKSVVVAKATTKKLTIAIDVNSSSTGATRTVIMGLASDSAITSTPSVAPFTVAVQSAPFSIISASVGAVQTVTDGTNAAVTVKIGETNRDLGNFAVAVTNTEDVKVNNITFTSSLTLNYFSNLYLYDDSLTKIDVKGVVDGSKVSFNLGDKAVLIPKSNTKNFYLKGDVVSGSSSTVAGRFQIQNNYDLVAKGQNSGVNVSVPSAQVPCYLSTGDITISYAEVSLTATSNVPSKIIMTSSHKGMIREWLVTAGGEQMTIDRVDMTVSPSAASVDLDSELSQFYLTDDKNNVVAGPVAITATAAGATTDVAFTDVNYIMNAGSSLKLQLRATAIDDTIAAAFGCDGQIKASGFDYTLATSNYVQTTFPASATPTYATKTVVAGSTVTVSKDESFTTTSKPVGSKNLTVGKWLFSSVDDATKITKVRVTSAQALYGYISNMGLYVDGTLKGSMTSTPTDASSDYFDLDLSASPLIIDVSSSKQIEIRADIDKLISDANTPYGLAIDVDDLTAYSVATNAASVKGTAADDAAIITNVLTATSAGTMTVGDPTSEQVAAGKALPDTEIELVRAKYSANNENISISRIELAGIMTTNADAVSEAVTDIKVYELNGTTPIGTLASMAVGTTQTTVNISITGLEVPSGGSKVIVVKGKLQKLSFDSGDIVKFGITAQGSDITGQSYEESVVRGVLSSRDIIVTAGQTWGGLLTQVDGKAEVALTADSPNGSVTSSSTMPLLKFTVKAIGGDIALSTGAITVTTGGTAGITMTSGYLKLYEVSSTGTETEKAALVNVSSTTGTLTLTQLNISKDETKTFIVRAANGSAITGATENKTLSITLTGLEICDLNSAGTMVTPIYLGGSSANAVLSGNAVKF